MALRKVAPRMPPTSRSGSGAETTSLTVGNCRKTALFIASSANQPTVKEMIVAAIGPSTLGLLRSSVYAGYAEPLDMRYAGITMCGVFLLGLLALPFLPETKGQPLPE